MGMSASQARLLSITARLTDNELRSQTITNSKLRLAEKSSEASQEYMNALNSEKLTFRYYNNNGESTSYNLTPALLYSYEPLKNQYSLQNASGQNLVSATDAANFEKSANLSEFLSKYGLVESTGLSENYKEQLKKYNAYKEEFKAWSAKNNDYIKYQADLETYKKDLTEYETQKKIYDAKKAKYDKDLSTYNTLKNQPDLSAMFTKVVGTSDDPKSCYAKALNENRIECFTHILAHLLNYDGGNAPTTTQYETSLGKNIGIKTNRFDDNAISYSAIGQSADFKAISAALEITSLYCDGDDNLSTSDDKENILKQIRNGKDEPSSTIKISDLPGYTAPPNSNPDTTLEPSEGSTTEATDSSTINSKEPSALDILTSDYKEEEIKNEDGTTDYKYTLKTLKEKAIDLLYIIQNQTIFGVDVETMKKMLINFTDGDMKKLSMDEPEEPIEPVKPTEPTAVDNPGKEPTKVNEPTQNAFEFTINDKDKGQWYVNLWYMMNGSESANKIKSSTNSDGETIYGIDDNAKKTSAQNYKVIEDELLTSTDWLQFALKNGIVTLSQASYFNPAEDSAKTSEYTAEGFYWSQKPYTNASDIISVQDDAAIARAEVKYKNATTEIENKDKKYDQDLKKLDTQHNALQTEYESLKNVIDKNVERSFKAFS